MANSKKFHLALAVKNLDESIVDYKQRLGVSPEVIVPGKYALFRTEGLNFSISERPEIAGQLRHLGFEDSAATSFSENKDCNGITWERFSAELQAQEIEEVYGNKNNLS